MPDPIATASSSPTIDPSLLAPPPDSFDQDMFLELLVAQLRYQDPMNPMDSSDMMAQTAQLTTVEKMTDLTDAIEVQLGNDQLTTATGFIGREVTYTGPDGLSHSDLVTGVRFAPAGPVLVLGDTEVAMTQIERVDQAG